MDSTTACHALIYSLGISTSLRTGPGLTTSDLDDFCEVPDHRAVETADENTSSELLRKPQHTPSDAAMRLEYSALP